MAAQQPKKKLTKAEAGRLGGLQTKRRHGRQHYQQAGAKGFMATVARHWQGDKEGYMRYLQTHAWHSYLIELMDGAPPPAPGEIRVTEIPLLPEEEEELDEEENPVVAHILASIRSAPMPAHRGL
jgi:hypothetical protein